MAREFDAGSSQYLLGASVPVASAPFTKGCWYWFDADHNGVLMSIGDKDTFNQDTYYLTVNATGADILQMHRRAGGVGDTTSGGGINKSVWNHAAMVIVDTDDATVYNNGSGTNDVTDVAIQNWDNMAIGSECDANQGTYYDGYIAEAAFWDAALTSDEIGALAGGVSPLRIRSENLVSYWPLYGIASPEPDYIGTINLTLVNAPTQADHAPVQVPFGYNISWIEPTVAVAAVTAGRLVDSIRLKSLVHGGLT